MTTLARFAQVTNPPIDSIREEAIWRWNAISALSAFVESTLEHAQRLPPHPIISNDELAALAGMDYRGWRSKTIDITYPLTADDSLVSLREALQRIGDEANKLSQTASASNFVRSSHRRRPRQ